MTNEQHNKYIAWAFFAHGAMHLLFMLFFVAMFAFIFNIPTRPGQPGPPMALFGLFFAFILIFQLAFTVPSFVAGYGLLKKKSWARVASIIAGVLSSMNVPIGTAACVYALWFFMGDNWKTIYPQDGEPVEGHRHRLEYGVESQRAAYEAEKREQVRFDPYDPPDWR